VVAVFGGEACDGLGPTCPSVDCSGRRRVRQGAAWVLISSKMVFGGMSVMSTQASILVDSVGSPSA
jgi:hypothetical protein